MTREIHNTPHPTPNPDGPHAVGPNRNVGAGSGRPSQPDDEPVTDEPNYDSCMDDLNLILSNPLSEPDPVLKSQSSSDTVPRAGQEGASVPTFLQERGKQPRTSEVFQRVGPQTADRKQLAAGTGKILESKPAESSSETETMFEGKNVVTSEASDHEPCATESATDDDHLVDSRLPWTLLLFMSYSSAVTLALAWVLWTGRALPSNDAPPASATASEPELVPRAVDSRVLAPLPPLPSESIAKLGDTVRLGDLEVTPLEIASRSLELVRSIEPGNWRRDDLPSLALRLRLKNVSAHTAFAPVDRRFLREQTAAVDRSTILTGKGKSINLYPLAVDSEWSIVGQEFHSLEPAESMETVIASEPGAEGQLTDETVWRVRLRIGPFRTDVLGVRFNNSDVAR